jgi:hypothetical protein
LALLRGVQVLFILKKLDDRAAEFDRSARRWKDHRTPSPAMFNPDDGSEVIICRTPRASMA